MDGQCSEGFILLILIITPLKGRIEVQIDLGGHFNTETIWLLSKTKVGVFKQYSQRNNLTSNTYWQKQ